MLALMSLNLNKGLQSPPHSCLYKPLETRPHHSVFVFTQDSTEEGKLEKVVAMDEQVDSRCIKVSLPSQITAAASLHMMMFDSEMTDDSLGSIEQPASNNSDDSSSHDDTSDHDTSDDNSDDDTSDHETSDSSSDDDTSDHETSDSSSDDDTSDHKTLDDDSSDDASVHDSIDDQSTENGTLLASINPEPVSYDVPEPMDESSIQDASVHMDEPTTYEILKDPHRDRKISLLTVMGSHTI